MSSGLKNIAGANMHLAAFQRIMNEVVQALPKNAPLPDTFIHDCDMVFDALDYPEINAPAVVDRKVLFVTDSRLYFEHLSGHDDGDFCVWYFWAAQEPDQFTKYDVLLLDISRPETVDVEGFRDKVSMFQSRVKSDGKVIEV